MFNNMKAGKPPVSLWSANISICGPRGAALVSVQLCGDGSLLWLWGKSPRLFCVNPLKSRRAIVRRLPRPSPALPRERELLYFCLHIKKVNFRENLMQTFLKSCTKSKYSGLKCKCEQWLHESLPVQNGLHHLCSNSQVINNTSFSLFPWLVAVAEAPPCVTRCHTVCGARLCLVHFLKSSINSFWPAGSSGTSCKHPADIIL